jgi:hypothetical protein
MNTALVFGVAAVPAIAGLVEVVKDIGLPTRAAPLASVLIGIALAQLQFWSPQLPWGSALISGAALGLAASGLYSGASTVVQGPSGTTPAHKARLKKIRSVKRPAVEAGLQVAAPSTATRPDGQASATPPREQSASTQETMS